MPNIALNRSAAIWPFIHCAEYGFNWLNRCDRYGNKTYVECREWNRTFEEKCAEWGNETRQECSSWFFLFKWACYAFTAVVYVVCLAIIFVVAFFVHCMCWLRSSSASRGG